MYIWNSFVLQEKAKSMAIPTHIVIDAGRTQIAPSQLPRLLVVYNISCIFFLDRILISFIFFPDSRTVMAVLGKFIFLSCLFLFP